MDQGAVPVADGVWRITTPMPSRPRTVHAYLLATDEGGWVLVDGGIDSDAAWAALAAGLRDAGVEPRRVALHLVTHMHVDHLGLAGRIRDATAAPLAMGGLDAERAAHAAANPDEEAAYRESLLRRNGAPDDFVRAMAAARRGGAGRSGFVPVDHAVWADLSALPRAPGWLAVATPGHTAGHVSLLRERDRLLVGGDAVLPRVTPTIGVNRHSPDPVGDYLATLGRLRALGLRRILPGHGDPLDEPDARLDEMEVETRAELGRVAALLTPTPATAWELSAARYPGRDLPPEQRMQALRETLAHLDHLAGSGVAASAEEGGVVRFWPS